MVTEKQKAKGQRRYRNYMRSQMDCHGDGCGECRVCRRLNFLEYVSMVAPRDIPYSIGPTNDVDAYIRRVYGN